MHLCVKCGVNTNARFCNGVIRSFQPGRVFNTVLALFKTLYSRRVLVRLIGVRFSKLVGGNHQINLFEDSEELINLYLALDNIRNRYGQDAVKRVVAMGSKGVGRSSNPFNGQPIVIPAHRRA